MSFGRGLSGRSDVFHNTRDQGSLNKPGLLHSPGLKQIIVGHGQPKLNKFPSADKKSYSRSLALNNTKDPADRPNQVLIAESLRELFWALTLL